MNDSDVVNIPLAIAVAVISVSAVLLISLAITVVFFDRAGYLRRFRKSPRVHSPARLGNGSVRGPTSARRPPTRTEPWGKQR